MQCVMKLCLGYVMNLGKNVFQGLSQKFTELSTENIADPKVCFEKTTQEICISSVNIPDLLNNGTQLLSNASLDLNQNNIKFPIFLNNQFAC